jgi:hypothetical protein
MMSDTLRTAGWSTTVVIALSSMIDAPIPGNAK